MSGPSVYVFDAYGTLFDVHAAIARHRAAAGPDADRFSEIWRPKQLEYAWTLTLAGHYADFWTLTERALDYAFDRVPSVEPRAAQQTARRLSHARRVCRRARRADRAEGAWPAHRHPLQRHAAYARGRGASVGHRRRCATPCSRSTPCACTSRGRKSTRWSPIVSASSRARSRSSRRTDGTSWAPRRSASAPSGSIARRCRRNIRINRRCTPCPTCRRCRSLAL